MAVARGPYWEEWVSSVHLQQPIMNRVQQMLPYIFSKHLFTRHAYETCN